MIERARVAVAWYFHLPAIASEIEVRDHIGGSLQPIINLHRDEDLPYLLAPTGSFLRHCAAVAPTVIETMRGELEAGRMCLAATYLYETDPLSVPWATLSAQIGEDVALKEALLGDRPRWFFLPNFVWRAGMERLLADNGIDAALLDSRQLAASSSARAWRWQTTPEGSLHTSSVQVPTAAWEHRQLRHLRGERSGLNLVFRDWMLTRELTFGNDGAIHQTDADGAIASILARRGPELDQDDLVVVADDGDRIRGTSLPGYRSLLRAVDRVVDWHGLLTEAPATPPLRELPSYTPPGLGVVLRESEDARLYWSLLAELRAFDWTHEERLELLQFDDVFYPFWPGVARRQWYLDRILDRIESANRRDEQGAEPERSSPVHPPVAGKDYWNV